MKSDAFVDAVHARDGDALAATFAEDIRFFSPVVFKPYSGRDVVKTIIVEGAMNTFEDFAYVHRIEQDNTATLIFSARVRDRTIDGLDLISFDSDGQVAELKVMIRPLSGLIATAEVMGAHFERLGLTAPAS